jgi:hypothetical protein
MCLVDGKVIAFSKSTAGLFDRVEASKVAGARQCLAHIAALYE